MGKALIIVAVIVAAALVIAVLIYVTHRAIQGPTTRRRDLRYYRDLAASQQKFIHTVENECGKFEDIDSVLATAIRRELHTLRVQQQRLEDTK